MSDLFEYRIHCPYCDEPIDVLIETLDEAQEYIEDCQVCCQPIVFRIDTGTPGDGEPEVFARREDDTF